jgi:TolB-like protein/class 3 adenylate cyclase/Tfp pilus assembly protein PilF
MERRLAAIFAADVVGYSRLMSEDEEGTLAALQAFREELFDPKIDEHSGRIVKLMGDGALVEFHSVVVAVRCAVEIQQGIVVRNKDQSPDRQIKLRIGINLGDVIVEGDDLYGDGVNVAARLESLADPGGICVSNAVRVQVEGKIPFGFEDMGEKEVKNIADPVHVFSVHIDKTKQIEAKRRRARSTERRRPVMAAALLLLLILGAGAVAWFYAWPPQKDQEPSIAVLPFARLGGSPEDEYLNDGVTEDIISALGRFPNLLILSRNAVFAYKGKTISAEQISKELKVRYLVEGSVRQSGTRVRVSAQLSDAERGVLLWSGRYDEGTGDIFAIQDEITSNVVGALVGRLNQLEQERAFAKPTDNLEAYDYMLRGRSFYYKNTRAANFQAKEMFEKAIALDSNFAVARAWLARSNLESALYGWTEWPARSLKRAFELAQSAVMLDDTSLIAHTVLAAIQVLRNRHDLAESEAKRAIALNSSHPDGHAILGLVLVFQGRLEEAIAALEKAERFDPQLVPSWSIYLGWAYFLNGQHDMAVLHFERMLVRSPEYPYIPVGLAAVYAAAGKPNDAAKAAENVRRVLPFFRVTEFAKQFRDDSQKEKIVRALKKAGLG